MSSEKRITSASFWKNNSKAYERHRVKVIRAKSAIDVKPPKSRPHVLYNAKGLQLEREKQERIVSENFILLKKLRDIMHRKRSEEETYRLKWEESEEPEEEGEFERYQSRDTLSTLSTEGYVLTRTEAESCLHTLGKCDSGVGYAYLALNASNKDLTDVSVILKFKHVIYVDVSGNRLTSEAFQVLSSMTYLLMLQADRNQISSSSLKPMSYLQVLTLNKNKLTSTMDISHKLLECLELNYNNIQEVTLNPYVMNNLKTLELRGNKLVSTNGIFFPSLVRLYLAENQITKLEGLEILTNLKILHLRDNKLTSLDGFSSSCKNLSYLNIRKNEILRISELQKLRCLPALETLIVMGNPGMKEDVVEEQVSYRYIVLAILPNLKRIDKDPIHFEEREEAKEFRRQLIRDGTQITDFDLDTAVPSSLLDVEP